MEGNIALPHWGCGASIPTDSEVSIFVSGQSASRLVEFGETVAAVLLELLSYVSTMAIND